MNSPTVDPVVPPAPSPADAAALRQIGEYAATDLQRTQARGEKWVAGVGALIGIVSGALVIKGKDSFAKLDPAYEVLGWDWLKPVWWVIVLLILSIGSYALAIYQSYKSAFGDPLNTDELSGLLLEFQTSPDGAAVALRNRVAERSSNSRKALKWAIIWSGVGVLFTVAALAVTWVVPDKASSSSTFCVVVTAGSETTTLKFEGALPTIVDGSYQVTACA